MCSIHPEFDCCALVSSIVHRLTIHCVTHYISVLVILPAGESCIAKGHEK